MSTREVVLSGGSPWGFRMHGGSDTGQPLRISRVNPGSKAAQKGVREGDVISSINGQPTRNLTNSDAHALLRNAGQSLRLGLNEDCGGSPKRRNYKMATSLSSTPLQSESSRTETTTKSGSASNGGDGGAAKEDDGKQTQKDRPSGRRGGRGRKNGAAPHPPSPPPADASEGGTERGEKEKEEAEVTGGGGESGGTDGEAFAGQRSRRAKRGARARRRARAKAEGLAAVISVKEGVATGCGASGCDAEEKNCGEERGKSPCCPSGGADASPSAGGCCLLLEEGSRDEECIEKRSKCLSGAEEREAEARVKETERGGVVEGRGEEEDWRETERRVEVEAKEKETKEVENRIGRESEEVRTEETKEGRREAGVMKGEGTKGERSEVREGGVEEGRLWERRGAEVASGDDDETPDAVESAAEAVADGREGSAAPEGGGRRRADETSPGETSGEVIPVNLIETVDSESGSREPDRRSMHGGEEKTSVTNVPTGGEDPDGPRIESRSGTNAVGDEGRSFDEERSLDSRSFSHRMEIKESVARCEFVCLEWNIAEEFYPLDCETSTEFEIVKPGKKEEGHVTSVAVPLLAPAKSETTPGCEEEEEEAPCGRMAEERPLSPVPSPPAPTPPAPSAPSAPSPPVVPSPPTCGEPRHLEPLTLLCDYADEGDVQFSSFSLPPLPPPPFSPPALSHHSSYDDETIFGFSTPSVADTHPVSELPHLSSLSSTPTPPSSPPPAAFSLEEPSSNTSTAGPSSPPPLPLPPEVIPSFAGSTEGFLSFGDHYYQSSRPFSPTGISYDVSTTPPLPLPRTTPSPPPSPSPTPPFSRTEVPPPEGDNTRDSPPPLQAVLSDATLSLEDRRAPLPVMPEEADIRRILLSMHLYEGMEVRSHLSFSRSGGPSPRRRRRGDRRADTFPPSGRGLLEVIEEEKTSCNSDEGGRSEERREAGRREAEGEVKTPEESSGEEEESRSKKTVGKAGSESEEASSRTCGGGCEKGASCGDKGAEGSYTKARGAGEGEGSEEREEEWVEGWREEEFVEEEAEGGVVEVDEEDEDGVVEVDEGVGGEEEESDKEVEVIVVEEIRGDDEDAERGAKVERRMSRELFIIPESDEEREEREERRERERTRGKAEEAMTEDSKIGESKCKGGAGGKEECPPNDLGREACEEREGTDECEGRAGEREGCGCEGAAAAAKKKNCEGAEEARGNEEASGREKGAEGVGGTAEGRCSSLSDANSSHEGVATDQCGLKGDLSTPPPYLSAADTSAPHVAGADKGEGRSEASGDAPSGTGGVAAERLVSACDGERNARVETVLVGDCEGMPRDMDRTRGNAGERDVDISFEEYGGKDSAESSVNRPESPLSDSAEISKAFEFQHPDSLVTLCLETVAGLPYGREILREIWTCTPPMLPDRKWRSSAPSPEGRPPGKDWGSREAEGSGGGKESGMPIDSEGARCTSSSPELDPAECERWPMQGAAGERGTADRLDASISNRERVGVGANRTLWVPVPTQGSVNICLTPKQLEGFSPSPEQAARLLDMHVKFLERRGYYEVRGEAGGREGAEEPDTSRAQIHAEGSGRDGRSEEEEAGERGEKGREGGAEGEGAEEGSRLLAMLLGEGDERGGKHRSPFPRAETRGSLPPAPPPPSSPPAPRPSSADSPRAAPSGLSAAAVAMGTGREEDGDAPAAAISDNRRLKTRVLSEWLTLARSGVEERGGREGLSPLSDSGARSSSTRRPPPSPSPEEEDDGKVDDLEIVVRPRQMPPPPASEVRSVSSSVSVRHSSYVEYSERIGEDDGATKGNDEEDGGGAEVRRRKFDAEKYRISKQGDIAIEIPVESANGGHTKGGGGGRGGRRHNKRPVSMPPAITGGEIFRQQMYMEYMNKVAERAERKQQKVIKLTAWAGQDGGSSSGSHAEPCPVTEEKFVSEFMGKVKQRMERVGVKVDDEDEEGTEGGWEKGVGAEGGESREERGPSFTIEGGLTELPKYLRDDTELLLADDVVVDGVGYSSQPQHPSLALPHPQQQVHGNPRSLHLPLPSGTEGGLTGDLLGEIDAALGGRLLLRSGVWTPSKSVEDLHTLSSSEQTQRKEEKRAPFKEVDSDSKEDVTPVWVPKSAGPSPTAERKEFRPVSFDAAALKFKKSEEPQPRSLTSPAPEESFAWQSRGRVESTNTSTTTERRSFIQSPTSPSSVTSVPPFSSRLPRAQNPTITLLQKAREGQLPRGAHYLADKEKMISKENDNEIMYTVKKEYETEDDKRKRKIVEFGPKKFEGIGPTTKEGIPIILRSSDYEGIKEENQAKWYRKMYDSLHRSGKDDEYVTVRYKARRGQYPYTSAEGYLSEPDPIGYDSDVGYSAKYATLDRRRIKNKDYNFSTSTMPRSKYTPPSTKYGPEIYKNQPGRIEDYEPGHSSIAEKEAKLWWDEVLDIFDGHANQNPQPVKPFMTHALKESGYESDSTLLFKRREENIQSLSPMEQKQAYKTIQMGGEVPLHGLRKPAPERPKDDSEIEYFPISPHLTRIRVHKHPTPVRPIRGLMCYPLRNLPPPLPPPPPPLFSHFKRTAPSALLSIPCPPARRSSHCNSTLKLWSRMMLSPSAHPRPLPTLPTGPNIRLLKERLSQKLGGVECPRAKRAAVPAHVRRHSASPVRDAGRSPSRPSSVPVAEGGGSPSRRRGAESVLRKPTSALTAPAEVRKAISKQKDAGEWSRRVSSPPSTSKDVGGRRIPLDRSSPSPSRALPRTAPISATPAHSCQRKESRKKEEKFSRSAAASGSVISKRREVSHSQKKSGASGESVEGGDAEKSRRRTSEHVVPAASNLPSKIKSEEQSRVKVQTTSLGVRKALVKRNGSSKVKSVLDQAKAKGRTSTEVAASAESRESRKRQREKKAKAASGKPTEKGRREEAAGVQERAFPSTSLPSASPATPDPSYRPCGLMGGANKDRKGKDAGPKEASTRDRMDGDAIEIRGEPERPGSGGSFFRRLLLDGEDKENIGRLFSRQIPLVLERARHSLTKATNRSEPSLHIYLAQRRAVSDSRFRAREREEGILARSAPVSPQRSAALSPQRSKSLSCKVTMFAELASTISKTRESKARSGEEKERSASEPPPSSKSNAEREANRYSREKRRMPSPPVSPRVSPVRSAASRRIRGEKARAMAKAADGGASEDLKSEEETVDWSLGPLHVSGLDDRDAKRSLGESGSTSSLNVRQKSDYQEYIADKLHSKKKSERFKDLHRLYASLERVGQLEKTASSIDLRRLKGEEVVDYERWRKIRAKEKAEEELHTLYGQLRAAQRDKRFLFRPKDIESVRWRGDRGLRIKEKSVDKLRELFCRAAIEAGSSRSHSSKLRVLTERQDVYKPLWRASSVINLAGSFASLQGRSRPSLRSGNFPALSRFTNLVKDSGLGRLHRTGSGRLWSSLSMEQMSALKSQLSDIYGSMSNVRRSWRGKPLSARQECISLPERPLQSEGSYEVNVPSRSRREAKRSGKDGEMDNLRVRCNSVLGSDQLYSPYVKRKEARRTDSLKADSIAYIPAVTKGTRYVALPTAGEGEGKRERRAEEKFKTTNQRALQVPLSETEKKRLSMTLGQEVMNRMTRQSDGDFPKGKAPQHALPPPTSPTQSEISPRTCYSLELSDDSEARGETRGESKSDLLLVLEPLDDGDKTREMTEWKVKPEGEDRNKGKMEEKSSVVHSNGSPSRKKARGPLSASESDSVSSDASSKTVIRREVLSKVDFFESKLNGERHTDTEIERASLRRSSSEVQGLKDSSQRRGVEAELGAGGSKVRARSAPGSFATSSASSRPSNIRPLRYSELYSRSYTNLKELFGERSRGESRSTSPIPKGRSSRSPGKRAFAAFDCGFSSLSRGRNYSPISRTCSLPQLRSRSVSPDPTKYWRSYLNVVKCGDVRRLRERFESVESGLSDDVKLRAWERGEGRALMPSPARYRSDPELSRRRDVPKKTAVMDRESGDVSGLRRRYEGSPPSGPRGGRTPSPPVPRSPLRAGDRFMPRLNVISKTAALQRRGRESLLHAHRRRHFPDTSSLAPTASGDVDRIRRQFEWLSAQGSLSLLGQMYTSAPNVKEICDLAHYLGWAPPPPPRPRAAGRTSYSTPDLRSPAQRDALQRVRPRPASASPQPRPSILRQRQQQPQQHGGRTDSDLCLLRSGVFAGQTFDPSAHRPRHRYLPGEEPAPTPLPSMPWTTGDHPARSSRPLSCKEPRYRGYSCPLPRNVTFKEPVIGPVPIPKAKDTNERNVAKESPHKYVESEVTIHYRSPIRAQAKEALPEEELARRQEEAMRRIYQEERRRKYLQELQDMESRRHTDNFTPSQKSPIPLNRYDNFLDEVPSKIKGRDHTPEPKVVARALYNFVGQTSRELSFRRGDIIFVRRQIDKNWYEGEHNAMIGLFPFNYVEIIPYEGIRTMPKRPTEGQARAKYNFVAQTHLELSLIKGELVVLTRRVDSNWFEGRIGNRKGIFPISYVEVLVEPGDRPATPSNKPITSKLAASPVSSSLILNGSNVLSSTTHSQPYHQQYIGKQQKQYQAPASYTQKTTYSSSLGRNQYSSKTRSSTAPKLQLPSVNQTLHIDTHSDPVPYRALYNYKPQNEDELELQEGDTVYVMEKCDDGWYVGSSHRTGYFGTFPGNYVERI